MISSLTADICSLNAVSYLATCRTGKLLPPEALRPGVPPEGIRVYAKRARTARWKQICSPAVQALRCRPDVG